MSATLTKPNAIVRINGAIPCVICWKLQTQENVDRGEVIFACGRKVVPTCESHFSAIVRDLEPDKFSANVLTFALAYGIAERVEPLNLEPRVRGVYEELKEKMKDWNHPAFVSEVFDN